jgi:hypothetical protein
MAKLNPKVEEWLLNPPPGSKAAAAKEFGIDLTLLIRTLKITPTERLKSLQGSMDSLEEFSKQAKIWREKKRDKSRTRNRNLS